MTTQSTTASSSPATGRHKATFSLLVAALVAVAVLAVVVWERSSENDPTALPAPAAAAPAPAQTFPPVTFYLVETADEAVALRALLEGPEYPLIAGTAEEQQRAYAHIELTQMNLPEREVRVIDRRFS